MRAPPTAGILLWLCACGAAEPARAPALSPKVDKASLYGDPALVPTREGERARAELAAAGELEAALRLLPGVEEVRGHVTLDETGAPIHAVVVLRHHAADPVALRRDATAVARGLLPAWPPERIEVLPLIATPPERPPPPRSPARASLLAIAMLGLGWSLGTAVERIRQRPGRDRSSWPSG